MRVTQPVPAYVLWFGPTGLSIARALARRGVQVFGLHDDANEPATCSRMASVSILPSIHVDPQAWVDHLIAEGRHHAPCRPVLFPASDATWLLVAQNRVELERWFRFPMPQLTDPLMWVNKSFQYAAAEDAGISTPRSEYPRTLADVQRIALRLQYPCLVKPLLSHLWVRAYNRKLAVADCAQSLIRLCSDALDRGLTFAVQEFVPAADNEIYGVHCYVDSRSQPLAACVVRKVRQYEPLFGSSCCSRSVHEPRVMELALRLLRTMGFHGISSVEFKRDPRTGEFRLMEVNVRAPLMLAVGVDSGINVPWVAYRDLCGLPFEPPPAPILGRRCSMLAHDLHAARFQRHVGQLTWLRWGVEALRTRDLYWAFDDPRPGLHSLRSLVDHWRQGRYRTLPDSFVSAAEWTVLMASRGRPAAEHEANSAGEPRSYGLTGSMSSDRVA